MASLNDSLRVKAKGMKGPSVTGPSPTSPPEIPTPSAGRSIADSKKVKNSGSTPIVGNSGDTTFYDGFGFGKSTTNKSVGSF